jgi:hypothetical protein
MAAIEFFIAISAMPCKVLDIITLGAAVNISRRQKTLFFWG